MTRTKMRKELLLGTVALMAGIAQSAPDAKERVRAFLDGKAAKVQKS